MSTAPHWDDSWPAEMPEAEIARRTKILAAIDALERQLEVADARLGAAEDMRWQASFAFALAAFLKWQSWLISITVYVACFAYYGWFYGRESRRIERELLALRATINP